ncbi:MAG: hypothetical protein JF886_01865 [Candidatus Dormibacteraeota bacterium]|uniref:Uncharacterized protein n=1 Tax=Candidatus Aeolococcus gillhamiae TaxID=3127015 RepID=A0A934N2G8_9BACT|nr:hypothetical protein [Candidatus Dormibacteraeota bacterium]
MTPTPAPTPTGAVQAAATKTPFTGGPEHPFPVAATLLTGAGLLLAVLAGVGPALLRRRLRR